MAAKDNGAHAREARRRLVLQCAPAVVQTRIELVHVVVVDAPGLKGLHDLLLEPVLVHDGGGVDGREPHVEEVGELLRGAVRVALNAVSAAVERLDVALDGGADGLVRVVGHANLVLEDVVDRELCGRAGDERHDCFGGVKKSGGRGPSILYFLFDVANERNELNGGDCEHGDRLHVVDDARAQIAVNLEGVFRPDLRDLDCVLLESVLVHEEVCAHGVDQELEELEHLARGTACNAPIQAIVLVADVLEPHVDVEQDVAVGGLERLDVVLERVVDGEALGRRRRRLIEERVLEDADKRVEGGKERGHLDCGVGRSSRRRRPLNFIFAHLQ